MAQRDWIRFIETLMAICQEEKAFEPMAKRVMETLNDFFDLSASRLSVHDLEGNWYHVQVPKNHDFSCCDGMLSDAAPAMLERRLKNNQQAACFMTPNLGAFTLMRDTPAETLFTSKELSLLIQAMDYLWSQLRKPFISTVEKEARLRSELEETRADFAWFFNHADDLFLIVDQHNRIVRENDAWQKTVGESAATYFKDGFITTVVQDDHEKANAATDALENEGRMIELTTRHKVRSGRIIHLRWRVKTSHGLYFATAHDITDLVEHHQALENEKDRYDRIARQSKIFAWEVNIEGLYTYASPIVKDILGYEPNEIEGTMYVHDLHPKDTREAFIKHVQQDMSEARQFSDYINPMVHKNGKVIWVSTTALPVCDEKGEVIAYQGSDMDVTEQVLAEQALKNKTEQFELAIEGSNDGIWDWDIVSDALFLSKRWKNQLGYEDTDWPTPTMRMIFDVIHPDDRTTANQQLIAYFKGERANFDAEMRMICKDGTIRWFRVRGAALRNDEGQAIRMAGSQTDITEQKEAAMILQKQHETLKTLALTDPLTQLSNHRALYEKLSEVTENMPEGKHVLVMLDLDNFKQVNDTFGHVYGDQVLMQVADFLRHHVHSEHIVGRYGGEEFMIVFINTSLKAALETIEAIRLDVETTYQDETVPLTISAGVKLYGGEPISEWVDMADRNLYVAKRAGKNTIRS